MRAFWLLVMLRLREVGRSGSGVFFQVGLPVLLVAVIGLVFLNGHPFERKRVVLLDGRPEAAALLGEFPELKRREGVGSEEAALGMLRSRGVVAVVVPGQVIVGPQDVLLGRGLVGALPGATLRVEPVPRWGYVHFLLPGVMMFSSLIAGFFGMGYPMVRYRQSLFLKKLATTPLARGWFIAAQLVSRASLALGQAVLILVVARMAFGLPVEAAAVPWLLLLSTLSILVFMGLGFVLACFITSEAAVVDAINVVTMPFVFLSEVFFQADELPGPLPQIASVLPSTQMVRLLRAVLLHNQLDLASLGPGLLVVVAWLVGSFAVSLAAFRWTPVRG